MGLVRGACGSPGQSSSCRHLWDGEELLPFLLLSTEEGRMCFDQRLRGRIQIFSRMRGWGCSCAMVINLPGVPYSRAGQ